MSTIVTATIPTDRFALDHTFQAIPDATFESVSSVAQGRSDMPLVWGNASDMETLTEEVRADPTTEDVEVLSELEDACLYRVTWHSPTRIFLTILSETDGALLDAYGTRRGWDVRFLFPERDAAGAAHEICEDYGIDLTIHSVCRLTCDQLREPLGLTDEQSNALLTALDAGYYDVPRETGLQELADRFDISHQALSERLRRGQRALVDGALSNRTTRARATDGGPGWSRERIDGESTP